MVRGLLIRQALTATNLLFALVIAYIIYLVCIQQFGTAPVDPTIGNRDPAIPDGGLPIKTVGQRSEYDAIVNGRLFGTAGTVAAVVAPPPVSDTLVQTSAPIKLLATVASFPTDPLATAIIENPTATTPIKTSTYYLGQMVTDSLRLLEVHRRRVILLNTAKSQKEELLMEQLGSATTLAKGGPGSARNAKLAGAEKADGANHVTLERKAVLEEINSYDYSDLMAQLNPQMVEDEKGNITGITSASLSSVPLAKQVGLKDNDVIQAVNGITIDSQEKIG